MKIFLQKQIITEKLYLEAKVYFNEKYLKELGEKSNLKESLVSRYLISKIFEEKFGVKYFEPKIDNFGKPIFYNSLLCQGIHKLDSLPLQGKEATKNSLFWSISHKDGLIFVGVSGFKIGLDIEIIKVRDESLLNTFSIENYNLLGGKKWEAFYILWTAKESIIKYRLINFDEIKDFNLIEFENKINKVCDIIFDLEILVNCDGVEYIIYSGTNSNEVFSLCMKKD